MKTLLASLLVAGALLLGATPAPGGAASTRSPAGIVPHIGGSVGAAAHSTTAASGIGPLAYQGGKVMTTNTAYAIYWMPSTSTCSGSPCTGYENAINQYFTDVAHDSGTNTNVYSVATQYCQGVLINTTACNGGGTPITYGATFGGSYVDTTAYPPSGCNDNHGGGDPVCLTDAQLHTEILNAISANSWSEDTSQPSHLYFIFTPSNVGICFDSSDTQCSTNVFCAYHDSFLSGGSADIAYAVEPNNATIPGGGCDSGEEPNGTGADATINTISHEHNEAITDPWPSFSPGWWANDGNESEIGDLCAWTFGAALGSTGGSGTEYNQVINSHLYFLQEEYSNAGSTHCLQRYTPVAPPPPSIPTDTVPPIVSGVVAQGKTLSTTTGTWTGSPTSYAYKWQRCASDGTSCVDIPSAIAATYNLASTDAGHEIRSEVSAHNAGGSSSYTPSITTEIVLPLPATTASPVVSGTTAVGKTLSTTQGTWNTPVSYAYEWLRCSSAGISCVSISGAKGSTYKISPADKGHKLEARVSGTNAAGTTAATSVSTAVVIAVPAASQLPHISGKAKVGKKLSVDAGSWSDSPTSFDYQWLRCSNGGTSCVAISGATNSSYKLKKKDAKHRLRVRVTAVNAAGSSKTTSDSSGVVQR